MASWEAVTIHEVSQKRQPIGPALQIEGCRLFFPPVFALDSHVVMPLQLIRGMWQTAFTSITAVVHLSFWILCFHPCVCASAFLSRFDSLKLTSLPKQLGSLTNSLLANKHRETLGLFQVFKQPTVGLVCNRPFSYLSPTADLSFLPSLVFTLDSWNCLVCCWDGHQLCMWRFSSLVHFQPTSLLPNEHFRSNMSQLPSQAQDWWPLWLLSSCEKCVYFCV